MATPPSVQVSRGIRAIAAWLVELLSARIRYTLLSVLFHIGVGWLSEFLPTVAFSRVAITGDILSGLWNPIILALFSAFVGALFVPDSRGDRAKTA